MRRFCLLSALFLLVAACGSTDRLGENESSAAGAGGRGPAVAAPGGSGGAGGQGLGAGGIAGGSAPANTKGDGGEGNGATAGGPPSGGEQPGTDDAGVPPGCLEVLGGQPGAFWPMRGFCATGASRSPHVGPASFDVATIAPLAGPSGASPIIDAAGNVYVASAGKLFGFDADLKPLAGYPLVFAQMNEATPAIDAFGTIYVGSTDGYVVTTPAAVRAPVAPGHAVAGIVLSGATTEAGATDVSVVAVSEDGAFAAFDASTMAVRHQGTIDGCRVGTRAPTVAGAGRVLVGCDDGRVMVIDGDAATLAARATGAIGSSILAHENDGFFGDDQGNVYHSHLDGTAPTFFALPGVLGAAPVGSPGIFAVTEGGDVLALATDEALAATVITNVSVPLRGTPAIDAGGVLFVGSADGNLYRVDPATQAVTTFQTDAAIAGSPAIGKDASVYVASRDGNLYRLQAAATPEPTP